MFNIKDYLLEKTFKQQQYDNELCFIVSYWFDDLLVDERCLENNEDRYNAMYNGKEYYIYFSDNKFGFTLIPQSEDIFNGDFDDVITFSKDNKSINLEIKNKKNNIYTDTNYNFTLEEFNNTVKGFCNYREFKDEDNSIYDFYIKSDKEPYYFINHYLINGDGYWYRSVIKRSETQENIKVFDSNNRNRSEKINYLEKANDINIPMISEMTYDLSKRTAHKKLSL